MFHQSNMQIEISVSQLKKCFNAHNLFVYPLCPFLEFFLFSRSNIILDNVFKTFFQNFVKGLVFVFIVLITVFWAKPNSIFYLLELDNYK